MNKQIVEDSIRTTLKTYASVAIVDDIEYKKSLAMIDTMSVESTVQKVLDYLYRNVGTETLNEINEFLTSSRYTEYLVSVDKASALISDDIKGYMEFLLDIKTEKSKMN